MEDQGAVVVKKLNIQVKGPKAATRIPSGLPEEKFFDISKHFKVIQRESSVKDEDLNERIQREGVHFNGKSTIEQPLTGEEAEWYARHKGYSKRLP
jgi:hypothetical protein